MKAVLDIAVALKWVLAEADSAKALNLRAEFKRGIHELLAPDTFPVECSNSLVKAERKKILQPGEAAGLIADVLSTPPDLYSYPPLLGRAVEIASDYRCSVYDCLYVALAEREGCECITSDGPVLRNLQPHFPFLVDLASLP